MSNKRGLIKMNLPSYLFYKYRRFAKLLQIFAMVLGPGIIVMVADNDAGGITTYTVTGAKYGYSFIWFLVLLARSLTLSRK